MNWREMLREPRRVAAALRAAGVLGMNERNHHYTMRWNRRELYPRVDDKLETKRLCEETGVPTARVLGTARFQADVHRLLAKLEDARTFVLKPAHGAMGNGILVIRERRGEDYVLASGAVFDRASVAHHASSIISGMFSLGGVNDVAFAEERLVVHPAMARIATNGVPDIRFVIFRGVPVMAMTRLPTSSSGGRANLHQGAVGAGIDLSTGRTTHAVIGDRIITRHPDSDEPLLDVEIPDFERALEIAVRATGATGLGYVGADVVVDAVHGALVLELNARPGLQVQVANQCGLAPRLAELETRADPQGLPIPERIALGRSLAVAT